MAQCMGLGQVREEQVPGRYQIATPSTGPHQSQRLLVHPPGKGELVMRLVCQSTSSVHTEKAGILWHGTSSLQKKINGQGVTRFIIILVGDGP